MSEQTATITKAYLRFIGDGLTFEGQVWRAGAVCETSDLATASLEPQVQRAKWGCVMFEPIGREEYDALKDIPAQVFRTLRRTDMTPTPPAMAYSANGEPLAVDPGKALPVSMQAAHTLQPLQIEKMLPEEQQVLPQSEFTPGFVTNMPAPPEPERWDWYADANDLSTIQHLVAMGETEVQEFLAFERGNKNRPGVIKIIETGEM